MRGDFAKYRTERTVYLRSTELSSYELDLVDKVERFGCMVLHVQEPNAPKPFFSYTVGLSETCNDPEVITCGLRADTAQSALNHAAKIMAQGVDLAVGRHREFVGEVAVEFRPVDPKWTGILMRSAVWLNGRRDFRALQLVFPDLDGRFPGDEGFNAYFDQPLLQPGAPMRHVEQSLWDTNSPDGKYFKWAFSDLPSARAYLSQTVLDGTEPVTYVSHDADDGAWQFLGESMADGGGPVLACLHHPIDADSSLLELADLPIGWYAERESPAHPWIRAELPPKEDE